MRMALLWHWGIYQLPAALLSKLWCEYVDSFTWFGCTSKLRQDRHLIWLMRRQYGHAEHQKRLRDSCDSDYRTFAIFVCFHNRQMFGRLTVNIYGLSWLNMTTFARTLSLTDSISLASRLFIKNESTRCLYIYIYLPSEALKCFKRLEPWTPQTKRRQSARQIVYRHICTNSGTARSTDLRQYTELGWHGSFCISMCIRIDSPTIAQMGAVLICLEYKHRHITPYSWTYAYNVQTLRLRLYTCQLKLPCL